MATTYEPIATTTLSSGANSITFSSISSAYTDLRLVLVGKSQPTNTRYPALQVNSDTGTNYSYTRLYGNGASATSQRGTNTSLISLVSNGMDDTYPVLITIDIFSYAGSTYKTMLWTTAEDDNGSGAIVEGVGLWRSTSAINSITLTATSGTGIYDTGTTATLYGIKAA